MLSNDSRTTAGRLAFTPSIMGKWFLGDADPIEGVAQTMRNALTLDPSPILLQKNWCTRDGKGQAFGPQGGGIVIEGPAP
jgi:hypothetical protein